MARKLIISMGFGELDGNDTVENLKIKTEDGVRNVPYMTFGIKEVSKLKEMVDNFIKAATEMDKQESMAENK